MPVVTLTTRLPVSSETAFAWHMRHGAFERLVPSWCRVQVLDRCGGIHDGGEMEFTLREGWGPSMRWHARHLRFVAGRRFEDEQVSGPFARWRHVHQFEPTGTSACDLADTIEYEMPLGPLGAALGRGLVHARLERLLAWRHERLTLDLRRHARYCSSSPLRIAIGGASGMIGTALTELLQTGGHQVLPIVRRTAQSEQEISWNPSRGEIDRARLEGCDAVVHLGGTTIARRFTARHKRDVLESRVGPTRLLAQTLASLERPPRVFICASAVGYYGDRGDEPVDEAADAGDGFLVDVAREWEAATQPADAAGVRTVNLRIGIVLSARGGALAAMLPLFHSGLGGRVGSGEQFMSWIALDDLLGAILHSVFDDRLRGPVNATAPRPECNRAFVATLGRVLRRPTVFPAPAWAIRALLGEMGQALLLDGARVAPAKLQQTGYEFAFPDLEPALRFELGRGPR